MNLNRVSGEIIDAAMKVHSRLGPGLLERAYQVCLLYELRQRGLQAKPEVLLPVVYDGVAIDAGFKIDLLIEDAVVVELKAVSKLLPIHQAQLLSYLKLSGYSLGLLMNFHVIHLKNGITRMVNRLRER
jgi:GxxExxY protein